MNKVSHTLKSSSLTKLFGPFRGKWLGLTWFATGLSCYSA